MNKTIVIGLLVATAVGVWAYTASKKAKAAPKAPSPNNRTWNYQGWEIYAEMQPNFMWNWTASAEGYEELAGTASTMTLAYDEAKIEIDNVLNPEPPLP